MVNDAISCVYVFNSKFLYSTAERWKKTSKNNCLGIFQAFTRRNNNSNDPVSFALFRVCTGLWTKYYQTPKHIERKRSGCFIVIEWPITSDFWQVSIKSVYFTIVLNPISYSARTSPHRILVKNNRKIFHFRSRLAKSS